MVFTPRIDSILDRAGKMHFFFLVNWTSLWVDLSCYANDSLSFLCIQTWTMISNRHCAGVQVTSLGLVFPDSSHLSADGGWCLHTLCDNFHALAVIFFSLSILVQWLLLPTPGGVQAEVRMDKTVTSSGITSVSIKRRKPTLCNTGRSWQETGVCEVSSANVVLHLISQKIALVPNEGIRMSVTNQHLWNWAGVEWVSWEGQFWAEVGIRIGIMRLQDIS